jgi:hypothetical protein
MKCASVDMIVAYFNFVFAEILFGVKLLNTFLFSTCEVGVFFDGFSGTWYGLCAQSSPIYTSESGRLAQLEARRIPNPEAGGSSPSLVITTFLTLLTYGQM